MTEADRRYLVPLRELLQRETGIFISDQKMFSFSSKMDKLLCREGFGGLKEVYEKFRAGDPVSRNLVISYSTINYTYFFREKNQLDFLTEDIVKNRDRRNFIWVAAASTGEEVYSIAICLLEKGLSDFLIIASDLDRDVLFELKRGIYEEGRLSNVSPHLRNKYFEPAGVRNGKLFRIKSLLKERVVVKRLNLVDPLRFEKKFHYIFCRNVMIYFDNDTRRQVVMTLFANLERDGFLFLGQSESLVSTGLAAGQRGPSIYNQASEAVR